MDFLHILDLRAGDRSSRLGPLYYGLIRKAVGNRFNSVKKIIYVIGSLGCGGAEKQTLMLAGLVREKGYQSSLFVLEAKGDLLSEAERLGVPVHDGGYVSTAPGFRKLMLLGDALVRLWRLLRNERPDVVHGVLPLANVMAALAGRAAGVPLVITSRRALNTHQERVRGWRFADKLGFALSDVVIANSNAVREDTLRREGGEPEKIKVIHNGIHLPDLRDPEKIRKEVRAELGIPQTAPVLITVANLIPYKGHFELIRALALVQAEYPDVQLLVVGEDRGIGAALKADAIRLRVDHCVQWLGLRSDVRRLLAASDLYVSASHEEGFSNALLEALAAGKEVVATRVGGNTEMLEDGDLGYLVDAGCPDSLAEAINVALPKAMKGGRAQKQVSKVVEKYSPQRMVEQYLEIYESGTRG